ncbi:hypothetical protein CCR97_10255 [Rhodoplanes elegans]|uniref:Uncharacterized protein n=1 Tax=Rhodoplanes elegans TaxID=29408 RepID=A0A327KNQ5_9BRAD|nr:hypothetical protein [Rhodoplanes elegans]MBK5958588.1 hypothetical protein [Rhodoplanes elegans]RAI40520.1 hypothetical protein CH338_05905 [Rhodoplanes elegans]
MTHQQVATVSPSGRSIELVERAVGDVAAITARLTRAIEYAGYGIDPDRELIPALTAARQLQTDGVPDRIGAWLNKARVPATDDEIAKHLALLVAAFPHAGRDHDLALYGRLLAEDVRATQPTVGALSAAVRTLRTTREWLPAIAAVLAEVAVQESKLRVATHSLARLDKVVEQASAALPELEKRAGARRRRAIAPFEKPASNEAAQ